MNVFATFLGGVAASRVLSFIGPFLIRLTIIPALALLKFLFRPLLVVGFLTYLMTLTAPIILARSGIDIPDFATAAAAVGRSSYTNWLAGPIEALSTVNVSDAVSNTLNYLEMDNEECKLLLSCNVGHFVDRNYPSVKDFVVQSG
jgi:hypothetical protein